MDVKLQDLIEEALCIKQTSQLSRKLGEKGVSMCLRHIKCSKTCISLYYSIFILNLVN